MSCSSFILKLGQLISDVKSPACTETDLPENDNLQKLSSIDGC